MTDQPAEEPGPPAIAPPEDIPPVSAEALVDGDVAGDGERRYPSTIGGACYLVLLATVVAGLVVVVHGDWRTGIRIMGAALLAGALARVALPGRDAGMLAVRHKAVDAVVLVALGAALIFLAGSIPDQPAF